VKTAIERSGAYKDMILKILREFSLPEELFYLPIVESLYNLNTVSHAGAVGLWQIMPHRGRALGLQINYWIDERRDPEKSTKAACTYLKQLYLMLNDWHLVLAAYNRGEYGLIRDMKFSNASDISEMVSRNAIPKETQNYVPQFIAAATIGSDIEKYGFTNLEYYSPQKYDTYQTDKIIDLKIVAQCAGTTVEEIKKLNPALNAWCTPHGYPNFELKIPYGSKESFIENIAKVKDLNPSPGFIKHKVAKGEWIEKIAAKYKTTPKEIYKDNSNLPKQKYLHQGQIIIIKPGRKYFA
jgi:membrane-bound lytic murein transglycosylase D